MWYFLSCVGVAVVVLLVRLKLAHYVEEELRLLSAACAGRAYNSIYAIEEHFSYDLLLSLAR